MNAARTWLLGAGVAGIVLAVGGAAYFDYVPQRPISMRAGYRVLAADFHVHTTWGDGALSPFGVVRQAARRGLDVVAITEHNRVFPSELAQSYARAFGGPVVVKGEEVTTGPFHVIALGVDHHVSPLQPLAAVLRAIHAQGGIAIAAHPVKPFWASMLPVRGDFDGSEVMHPMAYGNGNAAWRWADMERFHREADPALAAIGSSDYHWGSILGLCRTYVFINGDPSDAAVLAALKARRAVTIDLDGNGHGDPALVAALAANPMVEPDADYKYRGRGKVDRALQLAGLAGLLVLVLARKPAWLSMRPAA
jgi:PHP domain